MKTSSVLTKLALTILTGGIYGLYWLCKLNQEITVAFGPTVRFKSRGLVILTVLTGGAYLAYWSWKASAALYGPYDREGNIYPIFYVACCLVGLWVLPLAFLQHDADCTPSFAS